MTDVNTPIEAQEGPDLRGARVGALTAIKNGSVPMTVSKVIVEDTLVQIECVYFVGNAVKTFYAEVGAFVGFGENLVFTGGCFTLAYDDAEDGEEDE